MTMTPPITRDALVWVPAVAVASATGGGVVLGLEVAAVGVVAVLNLWLFALLSERFVHSVARGEGGGIWGLLLSVKPVLTLGAAVGAMFVMSPIAIALGVCPVVFGVATRGITLAIRPADSPALES